MLAGNILKKWRQFSLRAVLQVIKHFTPVVLGCQPATSMSPIRKSSMSLTVVSFFFLSFGSKIMSTVLISDSNNNLNIDPVLVQNAIESTATAINFDVTVTRSPESVPSQPTLSTSQKRTLSTLSPDKTDNSLLFSPPPASSPATTSVRTTSNKRSRTSKQATATGSKQNILGLAIHAVDSTIRHLDDSIVNKFVDPLKCIQDATQMIYKHPTISAIHRRLMLKQFSANTAIAATFISLPDDDARATYVIDTVGTTDDAMVG